MRRVVALIACVLSALVLPAGPAAAAPGPSSAPQYWFDAWHVFDLWGNGVRGQGIKIAEIDTGVNAALPDLSGRVLPGTDLGTDGNGQLDRDQDPFGHGTAMASIMVARPGTFDVTGLAPDAKVIPIAVPLNGTTDSELPDRLPDAIRYGADHGANIISMSLGGNRYPRTDSTSCPADEQSAVFYAMRKGAIVVAAVGNTGPTKNTIEEPGVCLGVVSVGAVDSRGKVAGFSARQPYLTLVAPGVAVASIGRIQGAAYSGDGTSQATAVASASLALVWSKYPTLSARQVVTRVLATLDRTGSGHSSAYGYGEINAYKAVTRNVSVDGANPVYDTAAPFLARDTALSQPGPAAKAPLPADTRHRGTGRYSVGSVPRLNPQVELGLGLAALGLLALLILIVVGLRRRRLSAATTAHVALEPVPPWAMPQPSPAQPVQSGGSPQPAPPAPHANSQAAPRPRPRPSPYPRADRRAPSD